MEVKKAVLIGGFAVGGFLLGRALLQPQAPKQSPPPTPPDPGFDDADKFIICGYEFRKASYWSGQYQNDDYYVPRIRAHINSYLTDSDYYAEIFAQYINHWTFKYGLPRDLTLAVAISRTSGGYNLNDDQIQTAIKEEFISCGASSRAQLPDQEIQGLQSKTSSNALGPWAVPATLWQPLSCVVDLLPQTPKDRLWQSTLVFTVLWNRLIKSTGRLESFKDLGADDRENVCDVVDIARKFSDLR